MNNYDNEHQKGREKMKKSCGRVCAILKIYSVGMTVLFIVSLSCVSFSLFSSVSTGQSTVAAETSADASGCVLADRVVLDSDMLDSVSANASSCAQKTTIRAVLSDNSFDGASGTATLPILFRGDLSPANAAYTINRPGLYKLTSAKMASGVPNISITANSVTLDLGGNTLTGGTNGIEIMGDNITVKNGAITGMTQSGVVVQGDCCLVENCDVMLCTTGITLENCNQCVVDNCRVRTATKTGVSLQSTWTSVVSGCEVAGVYGSNTVYGVLAQNGGTNSIEQCAVRDIQISSGGVSDKVVGIALSNETLSTLQANNIQAVSSLTTVSAYGIWINNGNNAVATNNKVTAVTTSNGRGQGVFVNQTDKYVANNTVYDCDISFTGVAADYITSQANMRGAYNIDTLMTTLDQVEVAGDSVTASASMVDGMVNDMSSITSMVNNRYDCSYLPIFAGDTGIIASGVYRLSATRTGDFAITATGVTFDMNGRTISDGKLVISGDRVNVSHGLIRGTTSGSTISGVSLTGNNCNLSDLRAVNCRTGFEVTGATKNTLENCQALNCTREGYLLTNARYNTLSECQVTSVVGTGTIAGIKTTGGIGNKFVNCGVNQVNSTASGDAYGIWGVTESRSQITNNVINDVSAPAGMATGLLVDQTMWMSNALSFTWAYYSPTYQLEQSPAWVSVRPGLAYVAFISFSNGTAFPQLTIFRYDESTNFNLCYQLNLPALTSDGIAVQWLQANGNIYLAAAWASTTAEIHVYIFDPISETLLPLPNATYLYSPTAGVDPSLEWLVLPDGRIFLSLAGEYDGTNIHVLSFDGDTLSLVTAANLSSLDINDMDWSVSGTGIFLAVVANTGISSLSILVYDVVNNTLQSKVSANANIGQGVKWLEYNNRMYAAVTSLNGTIGALYVFGFNPATNALTQLDGLNIGTHSAVKGPDWLVTGTSLYLGFGAFDNNEVFIYKFDQIANKLSSYFTIDLPDSTACYGVSWFTGTQGRALLAAGFACTRAGASSMLAVKVFGFDIVGTTSSIMEENTISNVVGALGTGLQANQLSEGILSNQVYNALAPYRKYPGWYDISNQIISG